MTSRVPQHSDRLFMAVYALMLAGGQDWASRVTIKTYISRASGIGWSSIQPCTVDDVIRQLAEFNLVSIGSVNHIPVYVARTALEIANGTYRTIDA